MLLWPVKWAFRIVGLLFIVVFAAALYFGVTLVQVYLTGRQYDPHPAGAIVVMGAAQYNGVPSPDLRARLNEALLLYHQGYSKLIMVTGYKEPGDAYTEAEAGAAYLERAGVPAADLLEAGGRDTWTNLSGAAPQLASRHALVVLIATDRFHEDRSMAVASSLGLDPSPTPTSTSPITGWSALPYYLKEAVAVGVGRIIGFQHV